MGRPSPYEGLPEAEWPAKTRGLIAAHPFKEKALKAALGHVFAQGFPKLGNLEYALDHGMSPGSLPHGYKGLEKGGYHFITRSIALELAKPSPDQWRIEEMEWGTLLRFSIDSLYSVKIVVGEGNENFPILPRWSKESRPTGYVLAVWVDIPRFLAHWGWFDRSDWRQIGAHFSVPSAIVEGKCIKLP